MAENAEKFKEDWRRATRWDKRLKAGTKITLAALLDYRNSQTGKAWPSVETLAIECSSSISTVERALREARRVGYVQTDGGRRRENGTQAPAEYGFVLPDDVPAWVFDPGVSRKDHRPSPTTDSETNSPSPTTDGKADMSPRFDAHRPSPMTTPPVTHDGDRPSPMTGEPLNRTPERTPDICPQADARGDSDSSLESKYRHGEPVGWEIGEMDLLSSKRTITAYLKTVTGDQDQATAESNYEWLHDEFVSACDWKRYSDWPKAFAGFAKQQLQKSGDATPPRTAPETPAEPSKPELDYMDRVKAFKSRKFANWRERQKEMNERKDSQE